MITIEQLRRNPIGKEHRTGGFQLSIKRARKTVEHGKKWLQEVLFLDSTGEIPGEILLPKYIPVHKGANIAITICWLQDGEDGKKLYVEQWKHVEWSADGYETSRGMNYSSDREDESVVRSMIRHGIVDAHRCKTGLDKKLTDEQMEIALSDEEFIYTGMKSK